MSLIKVLKCLTSPRNTWPGYFISYRHPSFFNASFKSNAYKLLHGIKLKQVFWTIMDLSLLMLNTCLTKIVTREGAC
jgi:hypothetical protein